ncbi:uncharacterized protein LOC122291048 [Carya illinoinensis]|uniref:uncharacterized protein LOC122291048 n=1 Tax=Carya illinoinensis TaxID=32201 RepID=UPI001C71FD27|nr:uncharacterized protein LOC122291048 [Carya illinoinensis]
MEATVIEEQNKMLLRPYTQQEVKTALFQMDGLSSLGPDGYPATFYKKHWRLVGDQISTAVLHVLNENGNLSEINSTYITLIPKKKSLTKVFEFRPISLCNIVAFEALHTMKAKMTGREGYMALKLDMIPQEVFHPSRGIRQGDPISPYIFILCAEALSKLIGKAEATGVINGVPIARGPLRVSHLFFADDSLLFCKANAFEWGRLFNLLRVYEEALGQRLNMDKTSIIFSKNTSRLTQHYILSIAGMRSSMTYEKYLGLPSIVGRNRTNSFKSILDAVRRKISGYKVKSLSQAGKEIFIKAVVQALPTYTMSVFKFPKTLLHSINNVINKFWWG